MKLSATEVDDRLKALELIVMSSDAAATENGMLATSLNTILKHYSVMSLTTISERVIRQDELIRELTAKIHNLESDNEHLKNACRTLKGSRDNHRERIVELENQDKPKLTPEQLENIAQDRKDVAVGSRDA